MDIFGEGKVIRLTATHQAFFCLQACFLSAQKIISLSVKLVNGGYIHSIMRVMNCLTTLVTKTFLRTLFVIHDERKTLKRKKEENPLPTPFPI